MEEKEEPTYPCKICERKFTDATLKKHEPICKKATTKKRKPFDSGKQRATGSDIPLNDVRKVKEEINKSRGQFKPPKTAWRERHEQLLSAVQSAKGVDYALKTGAPLPPPPKATVPSDYVNCEYCGRNFSRPSAERHIPFCKEQHSRQKSKAPTGSALSYNKSRQSSVPSHGSHMNGHVKGGSKADGRQRGAVSSANAKSAVDSEKRQHENEGTGGRNSRSVSAGRANPSRLPEPIRRGISPMKRLPSNARKK